MKLIKNLLILVMPLVLLIGCATPDANKGESAAGKGAQVEDHSGAQASGAQDAGAFKGNPLDDPNSPLATRVVYFDFDSSAIKDAARATIDAHAAYLSAHPGAKVVLEGHCDERGTRQYNIALGERRGKAVAQLMKLQGASSDQMSVISYGEERPAATGHDESAWSLNRRVEIVYKAR
jgi:peptidoglycan-associated lipoprotein